MIKLRSVIGAFDGISCGKHILDKLNIEYDNYYSYEIDKNAIKCSHDNHPDIIQLGDINNWKNHNLENVDLILSGSPCNSFSLSGKQLGLDDPRGQLLITFHELLNHYTPKYWMLENVVMKPEHLEIFNNLMGCKPITLNSGDISAQARIRNYWTNIPNIQPLEKKNINWGDIRDYNVSDISYYYSINGIKWLKKHSRNKDGKILRIYKDDEKMHTLTASHSKLYSAQRFFGILDNPSDDSIIQKMKDNNIVSIKEYSNYKDDVMLEYDESSKSLFTIKDGIRLPFTSFGIIESSDMFFRYLTVSECEKLMGFPLRYTKSLAKTNAYKVLGNSWHVGTIEHILKHMV